jgi:hypothetical protein
MKSQLFCPEINVDMRYKSIKNRELQCRHAIYNRGVCKISEYLRAYQAGGMVKNSSKIGLKSIMKGMIWNYLGY